jgi:outer membrane protein TolC
MIVKLLISLLSLLFATQAVAVELTVEDCVLLGLKQNENHKALGAEIEMYKQDAKIAFAELFPSIHLESSYVVRDQPPHFTLESNLFGQGSPPHDTNVEGEKENYTVGVRLKQPLFTGGRLSRTHQKQRLLVEARNHQLEDQRIRLTYQIKKGFYQALTRQHELLGVSETTLTQAEELRIFKELLSEGKATRDEILAAESNLLFAKAAKLQAEQAFQNALDDLGFLIGMDETVTIREPKTYSSLSPDFKILDDVTLNERKDIKRLNAQINAADKDIKVARSGYYPQLNLEASYLKQRETDIAEPEIWEAGVRLDWPLFEAGKTNAEVAKAKAEHLRLKHLRKGLERSIANEVKAALRLVRENEILVEASQLQLLATEQEHAYRLEFYHAGKQQALDVLKSRAKLATANANYRAAINHLRTSLVALETALSVPIEDKLIAQEIYRPNLRTLGETLTAPTSLPSPGTSRRPHVSINYPYALQLGAFRSEERARSFASSLEKDFPDRTFETVSIDGWLKVRATQFASREAVEAVLVKFGGKGFIVHTSTDNKGTD